MAPSASIRPLPAECRHCGSSTSGEEFCCTGCATVFDLLHREDLGRYYELQGGAGQPVAAVSATPDRKWTEAVAARIAAAAGPTRESVDIQGLHCAACVWLIEAIFRRHHGGLRVVVNPALGSAQLLVSPHFDFGAFVADVERFGYRLGVARKDGAPVGGSLLLRLGICVALAMNAMLFAIAGYAGLKDGRLHELFGVLELGLATLSVLIGGTVFLRSAWGALRRGILHMDLPIALGVLFAYGSSVVTWATAGGGAAYFDTLTVFIALMLFGRWLQDRVLDRNRRQLLASDGVDGLLARRIALDGSVGVVACRELRAGDRLLLAAGDLVCVDARLDTAASFSLDWIDGESIPREIPAGGLVPAGAFLVGDRPVMAIAAGDFEGSTLVRLLAAPAAPRESDAARATPWWRLIARAWVMGVLVAASGAFVFWMARGAGPQRALEVTTAVLIVTCPCAFGIATPLAYELAQAGLRRAGLFVRSPGFLDRALDVRRVAFDKTGTLTTGALRLADAAALDELTTEARRILYNLAARSSHPRAAAVARALASRWIPFAPDLEVREEAGRGLELVRDGRVWRLGAASWAAPGQVDGELVFALDGVPLARLRTIEETRPGAADEIAALRAKGLDIWILSGDAPARVAAMAARLGVAPAQALGGLTPDDKAAWLGEHDHRNTLFLGDGINDSLVVDRAFCSGTPAIDRPFLPARADFYFTTPGLRPIRLALDTARALARTSRRNLAMAVGYNTLTVGLSIAGLMSPLLCAVVMPLSSLTVVLATTASLSRRSSLWRS